MTSAYVSKEAVIEFWEREIRLSCYKIRDVPNQTPRLCKLAIDQDAYCLKYIHEHTPELCMYAVQRYPYNIRFLRTISKDVLMHCLRKRGVDILTHIHAWTPELAKYVLEYSVRFKPWIPKYLLPVE
jgi:hypothetical protein